MLDYLILKQTIMNKALTPQDLEAIRLAIQPDIKQAVATLDKKFGAVDRQLEALDARLTGSVRDLKEHFDRRFAGVEERLAVVETKVDAVLAELATRRELRNLVRELKAQGIRLDESKVFA